MFQPARGTRDVFGEDALKFDTVSALAETCLKSHGFGQIYTPIFEFSGVFNSLGSTSDVVTKETYTFADRNDESLTLRPEGTAGVVRAVVSNGLAQLAPLKFFYNGPMFRYERPQKGRYRQFNQIGVELIGPDKPQADIEVIAAAHDLLKRLGLADKVVLEINSLGDAESRDVYRAKIVDYFSHFKDKLSKESVERLNKNPLRILDSKDQGDQVLVKDAPSYLDSLNGDSAAYFEQVKTGLDALGIAYKINPRLVRGLDYYCHTAFEFITTELGAQSAVLAGGRYNGMVKAMGGADLGGVGWAAGLERLVLISDMDPQEAVDIAVIPVGEGPQVLAQKIAADLRAQNISVEMAYSGNMSKRMKKANAKKAAFAIIIGDDEMAKGTVVLKNLTAGSQDEIDVSQLVSQVTNRIKS